MAENPIHDYQADPLAVSQYDATDPSVFTDWEGRNSPAFSLFYERTYEHYESHVPLNYANRATQPTPDSILDMFETFSRAGESFYAPVDLESAPEVSHTLNLTVIAGLWTKGSKVIPGEDPVCHAVTSASCKPLAILEMDAYPIAIIAMDEAPLADLAQDAAPLATMVCKVIQ